METVDQKALAAELDAVQSLSELRLVHCETLQAEVERLQAETYELSQKLLQARKAAQEPGGQPMATVQPHPAILTGNLDQLAEHVAASAPASADVLRAFVVACSGRFLLDPEGVARKIDTDPSYIAALKSARDGCGDPAIWGHLEKLREAYSQRVI